VKTQHGTILKRSGSWAGRYSRWFSDPATGKKVRQQKSFIIGSVERMTKAEARRTLRTRIEQELGLRADSRVTIMWFIEQRWKPLREGQWRPSTKDVNDYMLGLINERFGTIALEDADPVALQLWINTIAKTRSGSLVRHLRILLRSIFAEAAEQDYVRKSAARMLRIPLLKPVQKPYLTLEQIKQLLSTAQGMDRIVIRLFLVTGLRPSELFALRWRSLDVEKGLLRITESVYRGKLRDYTKTTDATSRAELQVVYLPQDIITELIAFSTLEEGYSNDFMFASTTSNVPILKENFQHRRIDPLVCRAFHDGTCAKAGVKCKGNVPRVNYQVFRRSCATHMQGIGSVKDIQFALRHTKPQMAQEEYVQPVESSIRATVEKLATLLG
jgi:integrase